MKVLGVGGGTSWADKIKKRMLDKRISVKVGVVDGATYAGDEATSKKTGNPVKLNKQGQSVAEVAFWHEYGTKHMPPRPFLKPTSIVKSHEWARNLARLIRNGMTFRQALELVGHNMAEDIKETIMQGNFDPLAQSTIASKENAGLRAPSAPLQASMTLVQSIGHEVEE